MTGLKDDFQAPFIILSRQRVFFFRTTAASNRRFEGLKRDYDIFETLIIFQVSSQLNKNINMIVINNIIIIDILKKHIVT